MEHKAPIFDASNMMQRPRRFAIRVYAYLYVYIQICLCMAMVNGKW